MEFCGYTLPHPAEAKINFRIQMHRGRAVDAMKRGLQDLVKVCSHTLDTVNEEILSYKTQNNLIT